jgi:hypothetical protein
MTTMGGMSGTPSELGKLVEIDGSIRNSGMEEKLDLDAIFAHMQKKYMAKTGKTINDGWDESDE